MDDYSKCLKICTEEMALKPFQEFPVRIEIIINEALYYQPYTCKCL